MDNLWCFYWDIRYWYFKAVEKFLWILYFLNSHSWKIKTQIQVRKQRKYSGHEWRWPGLAPTAHTTDQSPLPGILVVEARCPPKGDPHSLHVTAHSFYYVSSNEQHLVATLLAFIRASVALRHVRWSNLDVYGHRLLIGPWSGHRQRNLLSFGHFF